MNLKKYKPTTPSKRQLILLNNSFLNKFPLIKSKIVGMANLSGRNNSGKITIRHKGGGNKQKYRKINFQRNYNSTSIVTSLEYDPNRTAYIASIYNSFQNIYDYIVAPLNLNIGDIVKSGFNANVKLGHTLCLKYIPVGSFIHCISVNFKKKAQLTRSAGTFSTVIEKTRKYCRIKLSSGEQRLIAAESYATIGIVSNQNNFLKILAKAGRSRWLNNRPKVRGVAMNPIDHPHGGGEGKTSGGRTSVTPWGKPTKNKVTSKSKNKLILISRKSKI
jgi:large subunit ribosomal protein L2